MKYNYKWTKKKKTIEYNGDSCMTGWVKDAIFSWSFGEQNPLLKSCRTCIYNLLVRAQIWVWSGKIENFVLQCINL